MQAATQSTAAKDGSFSNETLCKVCCPKICVFEALVGVHKQLSHNPVFRMRKQAVLYNTA
jgi:hypothetical protein